MQTYRLIFLDDGIGLAHKVEFEAPDAARALIIAHQEARERSAELWLDDRRLCTIRRERSPASQLAADLGFAGNASAGALASG